MKIHPRFTSRPLPLKLLTALLLMLALGARPARMVASDPGGGGDWPMWGATPDRNMVSNMIHLRLAGCMVEMGEIPNYRLFEKLVRHLHPTCLAEGLSVSRG